MTETSIPPAPEDQARRRFTRRGSDPKRLRWFGFSSFWGHLRHFAASFIATDDIDARDWMVPDDPHELAVRLASACDRKGEGDNVLSNCGSEFFIDYISDTGDHPGVSESMAGLLSRDYVLPSPSHDGETSNVTAPRGDLLLFGGDTAYPVATIGEIRNRLVVPFNRALPESDRARALLGIPGNHDWYDGLDGFARLFRMKDLHTHESEPTVECADTTHIGHTIELVGSFVTGDQVSKEKALVIRGYSPVQSASYFILPLADDLHIFGVDRQLKHMDYRQREFFRAWRGKHPDARLIVLLPNPVLEFGQLSRVGLDLLRSLELDPEQDEMLIFAGDIHHYRREKLGRATHVTAGGGGAFLHPAPLEKEHAAEVEFPGPKQSRKLLRRVPMHVASGRAGWIPHAVMGGFFAPALIVGALVGGHVGIASANVVAGIACAVIFAFIGGVRRSPRRIEVAFFAAIAGLLLSLTPTIVTWSMLSVSEMMAWEVPTPVYAIASFIAAIAMGGLIFGTYLTALTWTGLERTQAFTALAHPAFKHFLRMRVHADGSGVDVWCIGLVDPLAKGEQAVLVDRFHWPPESG